MRHVAVIACLGAVAACTEMGPKAVAPPDGPEVTLADIDLSPSQGPQFAPPLRPTVLDLTQTPPPPAPPPPANARTVDDFDTTTAEQRAEATAAPAEAAGETRLGTTIASLGAPTDPGIWFKTPLVSTVTQGRVEVPGGASVNVELRPSGGEPGSGSQISLAAMRLLGVPLTSLPELAVFSF